MTELEKKAEEYVINLYGVTNGFFYENKKRFNNHLGLVDYDLINSEKAYKDGYEQGISEKQLIVKIATDKNNELYEENELLKSKIKNVYEVRQKAQSEMISNLEKENEWLKQKLQETECSPNCQWQKENEQLKWEQKQILEDNESYQKENEELKAQIKELTTLYENMKSLYLGS